MSHLLGHAARLTLALVAATWGAPVARAQAVDPEAVDELVERTMKAFEAPGAAIAIVRGDAVVHLKQWFPWKWTATAPPRIAYPPARRRGTGVEARYARRSL